MPQAFSVNRRNPGHWDVYSDFGRAFRIRGEPGKVLVIDERRDESLYGRFPRAWMPFPTIAAAMGWIAFQFMCEEGHP